MVKDYHVIEALGKTEVVIENGKVTSVGEPLVDYCPIFDNGAALLSNAMDYPMNIDAEALVRSVRARPINTTFNRQMIHAINLYGIQLDIMRLATSDIKKAIGEPLSYYAKRDRGIIANRVMTTIEIRQAERIKILERM